MPVADQEDAFALGSGYWLANKRGALACFVHPNGAGFNLHVFSKANHRARPLS